MNDLHAFDKVMTNMTFFKLRAAIKHCVLALAAAMLLPLSPAFSAQQTFASPEAAVDAFVAAIKANDDQALISIFGDEYKNLVLSDDQAHKTALRAKTAERLSTFKKLETRSDNQRVLLIGEQAWPFPIPIVKEGNVWRFASELGVEEIINRRIGANENNAITVLKAYVDAQREYASADRNGDGVVQYAQKLASSPGKQDGLYWPTTDGEDASPFGPLIAESSAYLKGHKAGDPYRGYHFKILTKQGKHAAGGAYNYVINGRMIAGYAMVAYPAKYGETGVMTFIVNHNSKIFEKNLGKNSKQLGGNMTAFDPGAGWKEVTP